MSLGCARCGDCCDPVHLDPTVADNIDHWREYAEDFWNGGQPAPGSDMAFVLAHLTELKRTDTGWGHYRCDWFDPASRSCTAHDARPAMCSDYPWYDGEPGSNGASDRCSYWRDVPVADRPEGARPLIPLQVLR